MASGMFVYVDEVMESLNVSRTHAYKIIRLLNKELQDQGFVTISGRVSRKYFEERLYGLSYGRNDDEKIEDEARAGR